MKVSVIGCAGVPAVYGGFETLAENLVNYQSEWVNYTVFCSSRLYSSKQLSYGRAKLIYINLNANGLFSIFYDWIAMIKSLHSDVMLILGVSGSLLLPLIRIIYRGRIIINIDGIEWKREKWKWYARWLLQLSEKIAILFSDIVVGDNLGITKYVKENYNKDTHLIEYGADHVYVPINANIELPFFHQKYAITVCRIEPENNIHWILRAFENIDYYCLVIIGNWKNSDYGLSLYDEYKDRFSNIYLFDPIYDKERINILRSNATIYIHGHSAGGTNPSLVEAMYLGLPILAFDCIYNRSTTENNCIYWKDSEELLLSLINIEKNDLSKIGKKMKRIADCRFKWDIISKKYENLYVLESSLKCER